MTRDAPASADDEKDLVRTIEESGDSVAMALVLIPIAAVLIGVGMWAAQSNHASSMKFLIPGESIVLGAIAYIAAALQRRWAPGNTGAVAWYAVAGLSTATGLVVAVVSWDWQRSPEQLVRFWMGSAGIITGLILIGAKSRVLGHPDRR